MARIPEPGRDWGSGFRVYAPRDGDFPPLAPQEPRLVDGNTALGGRFRGRMPGDVVSQGADASGRRADWVANRNAILAGAREVLSRQPDASMAQIAETAGVHRGTVYRHFERREDLLLEVGLAHLQELRQVADGWPAEGPRDTEHLAAMSDELVAVARRWRVARYLPPYAPGTEHEFALLRQTCARVLAPGRRRPGLLREDLTTDDLARAWLLPLAMAADPASDAATPRRFMLAAIRGTSP